MKRNRLFAISVSQLFEILTAALFVQFILMPKRYMVAKALFLAGILIISQIRRKAVLRMNRYGYILIAYILYNICSTLLGISRGFAAYAIRNSTINIIWPLVFLLFMGENISAQQLKKLYRFFIWLTFLICIMDTLLLAGGILDRADILDFLNTFNLNGVLARKSGLYVFRTDHIYLYAFFSPFMIDTMFRNDRQEYTELGINRRFVCMVCLYAAVIAVLTGMGGVWLSMFAGFIICLVKYRTLLKRRYLGLLLGLLIAGILFLYLSYSSHGIAFYIMEEVKDHMFSGRANYDVTRSVQGAAMIEKWLQNPVFGTGIGGEVSYMRAGEYKDVAANELTYLAMLYQRGIIGAGLFWGVVFCAVRLLQQRRDAAWICAPFFTGMVSFLAANTFNPYLVNLSTMWILYLPFIIGMRDYGKISENNRKKQPVS